MHDFFCVGGCRLEIKHEDAWGTVCSQDWKATSAGMSVLQRVLQCVLQRVLQCVLQRVLQCDVVCVAVCAVVCAVVCCSVLQCVAVCCSQDWRATSADISVLQCVLQHVSRRVLQRVVVCVVVCAVKTGNPPVLVCV